MGTVKCQKTRSDVLPVHAPGFVMPCLVYATCRDLLPCTCPRPGHAAGFQSLPEVRAVAIMSACSAAASFTFSSKAAVQASRARLMSPFAAANCRQHQPWMCSKQASPLGAAVDCVAGAAGQSLPHAEADSIVQAITDLHLAAVMVGTQRNLGQGAGKWEWATVLMTQPSLN